MHNSWTRLNSSSVQSVVVDKKLPSKTVTNAFSFLLIATVMLGDRQYEYSVLTALLPSAATSMHILTSNSCSKVLRRYFAHDSCL